MPCYRCGVRQVDPVRGHSPWQRGVRGDQQVLVCPDCQAIPDWMADLDRCQQCGGVRLVRRLGEAECRDCGFVLPPEGAGSAPGEGGRDLSAERFGVPARPAASRGFAETSWPDAAGPGVGKSAAVTSSAAGAASGADAAGSPDAAGERGALGPRPAGVPARRQAPAAAVPAEPDPVAPGLSEEVALALERVLGRAARRHATTAPSARSRSA